MLTSPSCFTLVFYLFLHEALLFLFFFFFGSAAKTIKSLKYLPVLLRKQKITSEKSSPLYAHMDLSIFIIFLYSTVDSSWKIEVFDSHIYFILANKEHAKVLKNANRGTLFTKTLHSVSHFLKYFTTCRNYI